MSQYVIGDYWELGYAFGDYPILSDIQSLEPGAIVELFEVDLTPYGGELLRFHAGTNELRAAVVWAGNVYTAFPVSASGFEFNGQGQAPRPKLVVSNVVGSISALVLQYDDLVGAKVTRRRTLAKYLDQVNFPERRNLLTHTSEINAAEWFKSGGGLGSAPVVTPNAGLAPDGTMTADRVQFDLGGGTTSSDQSTLGYVSTTVVGQPYAESIYIKTDDGSAKSIRLDFNGTSGASPLHVVTGAWTRINNILSSATDNSRALRLRLRGGSGSSDSGTFLIWGAQFENSESLSGYQPVGEVWSANPTADPAAEFPADIFYIDRKANENNQFVEFELAPAMDVTGVMLPRRQIIQNICPWKYRGAECGYTGTAYFDSGDQPVATAGQDVCGKRLTSCEARFGEFAELPYGGFPAAGLFRT